MPDSESNAEKGMSLTEKNTAEPTETQKQQLQIQQQQPQGRLGYRDRIQSL